MTNVSATKIEGAEYKEAYKELTKLLSRGEGVIDCFMNSLLTESEKIMLVKRFATVFMLEHGYSNYRISMTLGVSTSTVQRIFEDFAKGRYTELLTSFRPKDKNDFLAFLSDLVLAQVSPTARSRMMRSVM